MPETSREFIVVLPDDNQFTVPVQPSLKASELLAMAASHCKIKEKMYFGLMMEEEGYRNWLELDKPVLDPSQEIPKGTEPVKIYLSFKYYIDSYLDLQDSVTVELLYLQSRKGIEKGEIQADVVETVFELSALVMQATNGPFTTEEEAFKLLQALPVIPAYLFEQQSIKTCETQVVKYYKLLEKLSRGEAVFKYLEIVQGLPMYSYHYFEVKDKHNVLLWLGVGPSGIVQCPHCNRNKQTTHYQWMDLQNIYYKDKKFSVEVYAAKSPRKGSSYQSGSSVAMHAWYGKNSKVVMAIWRMVRDQHIFYRNKRTKANDLAAEGEDLKVGMSTTEILRHLNHKHHHGSISPSSSHSSLSIESAKSNQTTATAEAIAAAKKAQQEMYTALLTKREVLVEELESKLTAYKGLLLKEMQITGVPPEGLTAEEIEKMRTKFSINFKFSKFVLDNNNSMGGEIEDLEKQLEVKSAIIEAQKSLLEQAKNRQMKKDRKKDIKAAEEEYQILEDRLYELKNRHQRRAYSESKFDSPGFSLPPPHVSSTNSKQTVRHSSPNSSMLLDDNVIAKMIFDESNQQISPLIMSPNSPVHKAASSLQDVTEMHKSRPLSPNPISTHRHISSSQSLAYSSPYQGSNSSFFSDSNRSYSAGTGLYGNESHDSFLKDYNHSVHSSATLPASMRYEDPMHRAGMHHEDYRQPFTPGKSSSPNNTPYHQRSHDPGGMPFQTHATITIPQQQQQQHHHPGHRNSSPDVIYSPNVRSSYTPSRGGTFSPEPPLQYGYQNQVSSPRMRPHSTPSVHQPRGSTPPMADPNYQNQRNSRGIIYNKDKEMDLQEALMMDQDEGTLV